MIKVTTFNFCKQAVLSCLVLLHCSTQAQHVEPEIKSVYPKETDIASPRFSQLPSTPNKFPLYTDLDNDGDPDVIELWWNEKRLRWLDEDDDASANDVWGDLQNDSLQVDMDGDGFYDGPSDYNVKWADRDDDGIADIQLFSRNPAEGFDWVFAKSDAIYFVMIDPDNTGVLTDIDWADLSVSWTRFDKGPNWRTNYHGNSTFLKEHAPIWSVENPQYSWENPFLFYDWDDDGLSEMSIRVADQRQFDKNDRNRLRFDGIVDEAWLSYDIDNDSGRDNEMDYDFTLNVAGKPGLDYRDQRHDYPQVKAPDWVLPYYRNAKWRQQTQFVYLDRKDAVNSLFNAQWKRAYLTVDEDDDSHRWERVEIYYPGDPYVLKRLNKNSPISHPQSDALGDRGEWDTDFSGEAKLYRAPWDGKMHLLGAEKGMWTVDINREYWAGVHPNEVGSTKMPEKVAEVITYADTDDNGFFDRITFDYDGDRKIDRSDSLLALNVEDIATIIDVTQTSWDGLRLENSNSANRSWREAQRLFTLAFRYGYVDNQIISFSKASSVQEKQIKAFWLKETIVRKILAVAPSKQHPDVMKAYYQNDIQGMEQQLKLILTANRSQPSSITRLAAMTKGYSDIFELSDSDRPGSWCWFQDKRVILDHVNSDNPILITGVVTFGERSSDKRGDIDLYWAELSSNKQKPLVSRTRFTLDDQLQMDDHASPSFMIRPDGRYLVNWSKHGNDQFIRTRISVNPGDPSTWTDIAKSDAPRSGITYTNPQYLADANDGEGMIFNGIRSKGFDSNFLTSKDLGENWQYGGQILNARDPWPDHADGGRAYVKYAGDGKSKVHLFATDDHPRVNFNDDRSAPGNNLNSIYHAYIEDGKLHKSDGTVIDDNLYDEDAAPPTDMTLLLKDRSVINGKAMRRGWITDIKITPDGYPFGVIQFRAEDSTEDHRYFYVRFDGQKWHVNFMAYAGDNFGPVNEGDYTGLASVDAANPNVVFISTSSNPVTGTPLISTETEQRQNEIYMGRTENLGETWQWSPLTQNSPKDNLRPIVPKWKNGKSVVLWMKGNYPKFYEYDTKIVGQIIEHK